jgi:N-acetylmuramoyl-L-alanine amidase
MRRLPPRHSRTLTAGLPLALAGSFAVVCGADAAVAADAASYTVQPGDTVTAIAGRHGLRTADVLSVNGLGVSSIIRPGDVLQLGAPAPAPVAAAAPAPASAAAAGSHVVTAGDTVSAIARAAGVSTRAVLDANGLTESSIIYPGETLVVPAAASAPPLVPGLDAEQSASVRLIVQIGRELGVPDRGIAIALGTAMQESWLRNIDWGDRDSLGLFQQRPSAGWGSEAEAMDAARATRAFFGGALDPNGSRTRGLLDVAGWQGMSFAEAAQAVQISAYPDRYAQWEQPATAWLAAVG